MIRRWDRRVAQMPAVPVIGQEESGRPSRAAAVVGMDMGPGFFHSRPG
jgi:hypothetical protein